MADRRRWWPYIVLALLAAGGMGWAIASQHRAAQAAEARHQTEQRLAEAELIIVGQDADIEKLTTTAHALREEIARVQEVFPDAEPRVVVDWRTRTERVEVPVPVERWRDRPCPPAGGPDREPAHLPLDLSAEGTTASLRSDAGTWFVVGEVIVTADAGAGPVTARLPWDAEATEALALYETPQLAAGGRWLVGLGPAVVDGELGGGALVVGPGWEPRLWRWHLGRWRPFAFAAGANASLYQPQIERRISDWQVCAAAGIGLEF